MPEFVVDTHALFWYLSGSSRLGARADAIFARGASGEAKLLLPAIVIAELFYTNEKAGRPLDFGAEMRRLLHADQFRFVPLHAIDMLEFGALTSVPEMHDRMIAAVAHRHNCACVTRDRSITQSTIPTIW